MRILLAILTCVFFMGCSSSDTTEDAALPVVDAVVKADSKKADLAVPLDAAKVDAAKVTDAAAKVDVAIDAKK